MTRRTRVFRFIDDITIEFHETTSGVRVRLKVALESEKAI